jgi:hypothetical protein
MELKTFIKQSLLEIAGAIKEVNEDTTTNMIVNPTNVSSSNGTKIVEVIKNSYVEIQDIKFDIAVTISGNIKGEAGASINVAGLKIGGSGEATDEHEKVSRIQFSIPVALPCDKSKEIPSEEYTETKCPSTMF